MKTKTYRGIELTAEENLYLEYDVLEYENEGHLTILEHLIEKTGEITDENLEATIDKVFEQFEKSKKAALDYEDDRSELDLDGIGENEKFVGVLFDNLNLPEFLVTEYGQVIYI